MNQQVWQSIGYGVIIVLVYFLFFYALFEVKLDKTSEGDWLLWYTGYDKKGYSKRKYIILFKKNQK